MLLPLVLQHFRLQGDLHYPQEQTRELAKNFYFVQIGRLRHCQGAYRLIISFMDEEEKNLDEGKIPEENDLQTGEEEEDEM